MKRNTFPNFVRDFRLPSAGMLRSNQELLTAANGVSPKLQRLPRYIVWESIPSGKVFTGCSSAAISPLNSFT
ncbi:MAG: hypothetical protein KJ666_10780 [Bacteroidetes bacterium]|nr:hypothetical protein [Bacteroidota bacterium]